MTWRNQQFVRGIKWANVPGGKAENASAGTSRVFHVNQVLGVLQESTTKPDRSGVITFRHRQRVTQTPTSILHIDVRSSDRFSNPVFPFTGRYPDGYDVVSVDSGSWTVQSPLTGVSLYAGAAYGSGTVFIAGGWGESFVALSSSFRFLSGTNIWSAMANMPRGKIDPAGALLGNSTRDFLVVGGSGSAAGELTSSFRYNPQTNVWMETSGTVVSRKDFQLVTLPDGRVFAPGGTGLSGSSVPFTGSEMFFSGSNHWAADATTYPPIPLPPYDREGYQLTLLLDGTVLLTGGRDRETLESTDHVLRFYPNDMNVPGSTGSWSVETSMSFPRSGHRSLRLDDGRVLIIGGATAFVGSLFSFLPIFMGEGDFTTTQVEIYDPASRSISSAGQLRDSRVNFAAVHHSSFSGRVIVCGGKGADGTILSGTEVFDAETMSWKSVQSMPVGVKDHEMFVVSGSARYSFIVPSGQMALSGSPAFHSSSQVYSTDG